MCFNWFISMKIWYVILYEFSSRSSKAHSNNSLSKWTVKLRFLWFIFEIYINFGLSFQRIQMEHVPKHIWAILWQKNVELCFNWFILISEKFKGTSEPFIVHTNCLIALSHFWNSFCQKKIKYTNRLSRKSAIFVTFFFKAHWSNFVIKRNC